MFRESRSRRDFLLYFVVCGSVIVNDLAGLLKLQTTNAKYHDTHTKKLLVGPKNQHANRCASTQLTVEVPKRHDGQILIGKSRQEKRHSGTRQVR
jgi:hypothetical protein